MWYIRARPRRSAVGQWTLGWHCSSVGSARQGPVYKWFVLVYFFQLPAVWMWWHGTLTHPVYLNEERAFLFARFWQQFTGFLMDGSAFYCPSFLGCTSSLWSTDRRLFCVACDTDKGLRRVHVSRMLPGKEERGARGFISSHVVLDVTFIIPRLDTAGHDEGGLPLDFYGALASCWMASTQRIRWTMIRELNSFGWMLSCDWLWYFFFL